MSKNDENTKITKKSNKTQIKSTSKAKTNKQSESKKNNAKTSTVKKNSTKKTTNTKLNNKSMSKPRTKNLKNAIENEVIKDKVVLEEVVENKKDIVVEQVKVEKEIFDEISNINSAKIENAKYTIRKKNKLAISIGVFISLLGIIALVITLIANRIIDREFISDTEIIFMLIISIIIEIMGAAIIVKET